MGQPRQDPVGSYRPVLEHRTRPRPVVRVYSLREAVTHHSPGLQPPPMVMNVGYELLYRPQSKDGPVLVIRRV
jgi:hypothetical protein